MPFPNNYRKGDHPMVSRRLRTGVMGAAVGAALVVLQATAAVAATDVDVSDMAKLMTSNVAVELKVEYRCEKGAQFPGLSATVTQNVRGRVTQVVVFNGNKLTCNNKAQQMTIFVTAPNESRGFRTGDAFVRVDLFGCATPEEGCGPTAVEKEIRLVQGNDSGSELGGDLSLNLGVLDLGLL